MFELLVTAHVSDFEPAIPLQRGDYFTAVHAELSLSSAHFSLYTLHTHLEKFVGALPPENKSPPPRIRPAVENTRPYENYRRRRSLPALWKAPLG